MTTGMQMLIAAARKFVAKVESGRAKSVVTYRELKAALEEIDREKKKVVHEV